MPEAHDPQLVADASGVWQSNGSRRSGYAWDEIYRIGGHKLDAITHIITVVTLDTEYGEYMELLGDSEGFDDVIRAITLQIPHLSADWFEQIQAIELGSTIEVWKRMEPT